MALISTCIRRFHERSGEHRIYSDQRVASFGCESRHVDVLTQENIASLRNRGFPCPLARLADTGIESYIGDQLFGRVKLL